MLLFFFQSRWLTAKVFSNLRHRALVGWGIYRPSVCVYLWILYMHILPTDAAAAAVVAALSASGSPHLWPYVYTHTWCIYACIYIPSVRAWVTFWVKFAFSFLPKGRKKETKKFLYMFEKFVERLIEIIALLGEMLEAAQQVLGKNGHGSSKRFRVTTLRFWRGKRERRSYERKRKKDSWRTHRFSFIITIHYRFHWTLDFPPEQIQSSPPSVQRGVLHDGIHRPLAISLAKQKRLVKETLACVAVIFFFASSLFVSTLPLPLLITKWLGFLFSSSAQLRYSRHFYPPHLGCVKSLKNFLFQK